jgi:hypothetical protein
MGEGPVPNELKADMSVKDFEIRGLKFKWRPLSWYDEEKLRNDCMTADPVSRKLTVNTAEMHKRYLMGCIVEAPFALTIENFMMLDSDVKDDILSVIAPARKVEELEKK